MVASALLLLGLIKVGERFQIHPVPHKGEGRGYCCIARPVAGSQLVVVNYLFRLIFLPCLGWKLRSNRNRLTHFWVSLATVLTPWALRKYLWQQCRAQDQTPPLYVPPSSSSSRIQPEECQEASPAHKDRGR